MVKVGFLEDKPVMLAALAVKVSQTPFEQGTIQELYEECQKKPNNSQRLVNRIIKKNRHLIFGDFLPYAITLEDVSRLAAIYLWRNVNVHNLIFGAGIEASLRVIKPNRYNETASDLGRVALRAYEQLLEQGIPNQDARYILPQGILTRMIFTAPPRYLIKLADILKSAPLLELQEVAEAISMIVLEKFSLEIPKETIPSEWNFWGREDIVQENSIDYRKKLHSLSLNMKIRGSLSMYAQLVRQRQLLCEIESLESIAQFSKFVVPPSFSPKAKEHYQNIAFLARQKQLQMIKEKNPNFVYFLLMGQEAKAMIYGKGSGVIETSRARSEGVAQWEIRNAVGIPITRELAKYPELEKEIGPRCWREGRCSEPEIFKTQKSICPAFAKKGGIWLGSLEELLQTLTESYETFTV